MSHFRFMDARAAELLDSYDVASHALVRLGDAIPANTACALLDYPDHPNVGDSAIWLGEREFVRHRKLRVAYSCSLKTFDEAALRRVMPRGIVMIHGGGNFGTLWPHHQALRETVLERLRDYAVIQLPQSILYEDAQALERTARLIAAHPNFTLFVRDETSLKIGIEQLRARTILCPDSALLLEGKLRRRPPDVDCLILARTDKERACDGLERAFGDLGLSVATADWLDEPRTRLHGLRDRFIRASHKSWSANSLFQSAMLQVWDRLAGQRTQRGCDLLSRGRIVVTDRLHAHILSTLLGIPNVVLDNNYGKLSGFIAAWTARNPLCHQAATIDQAKQTAIGLLRSRSP